jgi:hypothetical protein
MTNAVDAARDRIGRAILETWKPRDIDQLVRLMRKFADDLKAIERRKIGRPTATGERSGAPGESETLAEARNKTASLGQARPRLRDGG